MVSDMGMLVVDPLGPVGWGFHRSGLLQHKQIPTDAQWDWDSGNFGGQGRHIGFLGSVLCACSSAVFGCVAHVKCHPR